MAEEKIRGLHDRRARVTFFLPLMEEGHEKAIHSIIEHLNQQRDSPIPVTGYTYSTLRPAAFIGCWWDDENPQRKQLIEEDVVCFIVDYGIRLGALELPSVLAQLKQAILKAYRQYGVPQTHLPPGRSGANSRM
jgi:hypothetical protein